MGGELLVAASNEANLGFGDATPIDTGYRDLSSFDLGNLLNSAPPVTFHALGSEVGGSTWGGIPLDGYERPSLVCDISESNKLTVNEYHLSLPVALPSRESYELKPGRNRVDLAPFNGIVSFKLERKDPESNFWVTLNR